MLLMNRLLKLTIALKPPPSRIKNSSSLVINDEYKKKHNKLFVIMVAIVKVKTLEIKVRKKLRKRRKLFEMNKILNIKATQSQTGFYDSKIPEINTSRSINITKSSTASNTNNNSIIMSNARKFMEDTSDYNYHNLATIKPIQTPTREFLKSSNNLSRKRAFSLHKGTQLYTNSLSNMAMLKCNYYLKQDSIYGDKKLKMSGKNVLPEQLPKDLKNINRLVKLAHSMSMKGDESINNGDTTTTTTTLANLSSNHNHKPESRANAFKQQINSNLKNLQELVVLDLSTERQSCLNFPLIQIPIELFKLSQLKRLHFDCNQIKYIPDEFGLAMVNLETLTISNNRLKWLPPTFKNLKKLQSLHLSHNRFDLFPTVLCEMPKLRFLDLSSNNIDDLPDTVGNLVDIESLLLFHNNIRDVPASIGNLTNLRTLWLGENQISKLPKSITRLKYLDWNEDSFYLSSNLVGNPLVEPPLNICLKGIQAIREYFQEREGRKSTKSATQSNSQLSNRSRLSNVSQLSSIKN